MTEAPPPLHAGAAVFIRAMALLAAATGIFLVVNHLQGDGFCNPAESAGNALVMAFLVGFPGLVVLLFGVLRPKYRGVRMATLLGWTVSLLPALLLLAVARHYVAAVTPGCPT